MDYFLDETGQTQPIFCLAAAGVANEVSLEQEINGLKEKHSIGIDELKSKSRRERQKFTYGVVKLVCMKQLSVLLGRVCTRSIIWPAHITSRQLLPPIRGLAADPQTHFFQNLIADYLFDHLPDAVFAKFIEACPSPSHETLSAQFLPRSISRAPLLVREKLLPVFDLAITALKGYEEPHTNTRDLAFFDYLPIPDDHKYQKLVWILLNLSAFANPLRADQSLRERPTHQCSPDPR